MPFQNIISLGGNAVVISVLDINAGPNQFAICDPSATLTGTVTLEPGDLTVHSYLWEQISGTPVTWLTPLTGFTVSYTTTSSDDKRFRFTADKNTSSEKFDEVIIYGTPTSTATITDNLTEIATYTCRSVSLSYLMEPSTVGSLTPTTQYRLNWSLPSCNDDNRLVEYWVQSKSVLGPWNTFEVVPAGNPRTSVTSSITDTFRVYAVYTDGLNAASNLIYTPTSGVSGILLNELTVTDNLTHNITTYSVVQLTLSTQPVADNHTITDNLTHTISTYSVVQLTLIANAVADNHVINDTNTSIIDFYEVVDLTGGNIGG